MGRAIASVIGIKADLQSDYIPRPTFRLVSPNPTGVLRATNPRRSPHVLGLGGAAGGTVVTGTA